MRVDTRRTVIEQPPVVTPPRWEYRSCLMERESDLSQYGSEGWECYSIVDAGADKAMFYFKRRRA